MTVKIYRPTKNSMQSGKANIKEWILEHKLEDTRYIEPVMGWTGNSDTKRQIRLKFNNKEDAIAYANRKKLAYEVIEPKQPKLHKQAYSDNFI